LITIDRGLGIDDIPKALERGSSSRDRPQAGKGLSNLLLAMDEVEIESVVGKGTKIVARKWAG
jgi:anti-sigma regulatory factor (Ser/Thr protein kinase)